MRDYINRKPWLPYAVGYLLSLVLTINAYTLVVANATLQPGGRPSTDLVVTLVALAVAQLLVQVVFFVQLGHDPKPRWNIMAFIVMIMVVLFIVIGSLWIMNNLNYNMTPADQLEQTIMNDEGINPNHSQ